MRDVVLKSPTACYFAHPGFSGTILCVIFLRGVGIVGEPPASAQVLDHRNPEDGGSMDDDGSVNVGKAENHLPS